MSEKIIPLFALAAVFALGSMCLHWAISTNQQISADRCTLIKKLAQSKNTEKRNDQCGQNYVAPPVLLSVCPAVHWLQQLDEQGLGEQIQCYCPCQFLSTVHNQKLYPLPQKPLTMTYEVTETEVEDIADVDAEIEAISEEETQDSTESIAEAETDVPAAELTQEQENEVRRRKDQVVRDAQAELNNLESLKSAAASEVRSYTKSIAEAKAKVNRLVFTDVSGFLNWEKEQELPLLQMAEVAANAWRDESIEKLDVPAKDKKKLVKHFSNCGEVADWLGKDWPEKKTGLNDAETKERLRDAINKISGNGGQL